MVQTQLAIPARAAGGTRADPLFSLPRPPGRARRTRHEGSAVRAPHPVILLLLLLCLLAPGPRPAFAAPAAGSAPVTLLRLEGAIGPATADYLVRGLARAAGNGSQLAVIQMDTPGGLDSAMRHIIQAILASPIPVASYVAPGGAHAASAGTYILYASHIAAMAPGTNLGAATPVALGGPAPAASPAPRDDAAGGQDGTAPATLKSINDAAAYLRGLAQLRGRNAAWAERAVREAVSLPAQEALQQQVIEHVAPSLRTLLRQVDGETVSISGGRHRLHTADAPVQELLPDWRTRLLSAITNPNVALLLMVIGFYGLMFEFLSPGFGLPGVAGAICLLLGLYALQLLPVNYAGLALILLGLGLMVAEAFLPSFGALGLGGVAAFVGGGIMLMDTEAPGYGIPIAALLVLGVVSALLLAVMAGVLLKTRRLAVDRGPDILTGGRAEVELVQPGTLWVRHQGVLWQAESAATLEPGQRVSVTGRRGLVLQVVPIRDDKQGE